MLKPLYRSNGTPLSSPRPDPMLSSRPGIGCANCGRRGQELYRCWDCVCTRDGYHCTPSCFEPEGTEGQDRESYTDDQDRESYEPKGD